MPIFTGSNRNTVTLLLLVSLFLGGCRDRDNKTPFPVNESEFAQPSPRPFAFSEAVSIKWEVTPADSIKAMPEKKFNLTALPSKPFDAGEAVPFTKPLEEKKFDWDKITDTVFNINTLPIQKLQFKTFLLGQPTFSKAGPAAVKQGASRGVMDAGKDMGLMNNGRCFFHDKNGLLWIGTDKGLWRYDGINWATYSKKQGLNEENITSILEDNQSGIWIGTMTGIIFRLEIKTGLLRQLIDTIPGGSEYGMMKDDSGRIWIGKGGFGIRIIDIEKQTIKTFSSKEGLLQDFNVGIIQDKQGLIWISSLAGVNVLNLKKQLNKRIRKINGLTADRNFSLLLDNRDRIWVGGSNGVDIIDKQKGTITNLWKDQGLVYGKFFPGLYQDKAGEVWVGTDTGIVYRIDPKINTLEKLILFPGASNVIYSFSEDSNGQLWFGSIQGGCFFINPNNGRPANFTTAQGLGGNNIWSIKEDNDGNLWLGTYNGIDIVNRSAHTIKHIDKSHGLLVDRANTIYKDSHGLIWANANNQGINIIDTKQGVIKNFTKAQGLPFNSITAFMEDSRGQMWLGANNGDVYVMNLSNKSIKKIANTPDRSENMINTFKEDRNGQIWISKLVGGVFVVDWNSQTIKHLSTPQGLISNEATTLFEDQQNNMWVGTEKGIDIVNVKNKTLSSFTTLEGLTASALYTLDENNGNIYVGTSNGLNILRQVSEENKAGTNWKVYSIGKPQGLSFVDFAENSSYISKDGQFWAGVEDQILTIIDNPTSDTIRNNTLVTGIHILDRPQIFSDRKKLEKELEQVDTLWKYEKDSFYVKKQLPVDSGYLQKNNISWDSLDGPYLMPVDLRLPYDQNYLSFTFTGTHIANPEQAKYRYILEGIDKNWSPISENSFSENYRDLPPGKYIFRVSSKGMNGLWCNPAEFSFTIMPPWWKTWWAYLLYALLFAGLIRAYILFRSGNLRRQNQLLEEKVENRTTELKKSLHDLQETQKQLIQSEKMASLGELTAGIAHEIQNPLNFINNFSEVNTELIAEMKEEIEKGNMEEVKALANDISDNEQKITHHGKRADGIVKGMLQHSRTGSREKEPTSINALADEYLRLAYHGLRAKDKSFNATMKTDFDESIGMINIITQDIGRVILNLITNAFYSVTEKKKQVGDGYEPTVSVSTKKINGKIEIRVKDNGNGVPQKVLDKIFQPFFTTKPTGEGTGLGLSLSYDIIKAHGGELKVETKEKEFAEFIIILPQ
jgi:ligand-binding sensor domain-containing protein/signal transduction histidine kinase